MMECCCLKFFSVVAVFECGCVNVIELCVYLITDSKFSCFKNIYSFQV